LGQLVILIPTNKFILLAYWPIRFTKSEHKIRTQILSGSPTACWSLQPSMMSNATIMPKWAWIIIW
jgi:hypothetical protein